MTARSRLALLVSGFAFLLVFLSLFALPSGSLRAYFYSDPETTIVERPPELGSSGAVTYSFRSDQKGSAFQCRWGQGEWNKCVSPLSRTGLKSGQYTFSVRATNNGRTDKTPATDDFQIDRDPPQTTIKGDRNWSKENVSLRLGANEPVSGYECSLDKGAWKNCQTDWSARVSTGKHSLRARATDRAGNVDPSPAVHEFTVTKPAPPAPKTTISGPSRTKDPTPTFKLASDQAKVTFQCSVDGGAWRACGTNFTTSKLKLGAHTVRARATNAGGKTDPSPASKQFTIIK